MLRAVVFPWLGLSKVLAQESTVFTAGSIRNAMSTQNIASRRSQPSIAAITNAASFVSPAGPDAGVGCCVVPGGIVAIFGTNLTNVSGIVTASETPLPTELNGTRVEFVGTNGDGENGPGHILAVANINGQEQINAQVPNRILGLGCLTSAPDGCDISVVVISNGVPSAPVVVNSRISSPGIFTVDGTTGVITHSNTNQLVTTSAPAVAGEVVSIYATGLGPIFSNAPPDGETASANPPTQGPVPAVTIGGKEAKVLRSILAPGLVGVNQIDVQLPAGVSSGSVDVYLGAQGLVCVAGARCSDWTSNAAKMWVQ